MSSSLGELIERLPRSLVARKKTYQGKIWATLKYNRQKLCRLGEPSHYIWIFGCQRSGTTFLERIFRSDLNSAVFSEFSELTILPERTVWKVLPKVETTLSSSNARYAVARPLFESDRAVEILDYFPQSVGVWMFRDHRYVVNSMINKWGDRFFDISHRVEADLEGGWRLNQLYETIKEEAKQATGSDNNIKDLYALYWLKRNELIYKMSLNENDRILFLNYSQLVTRPKATIDRIIKHAGGVGVWSYFTADARADFLNRSIDLEISPKIDECCLELYKNLCVLGERDFPKK